MKYFSTPSSVTEYYLNPEPGQVELPRSIVEEVEKAALESGLQPGDEVFYDHDFGLSPLNDRCMLKLAVARMRRSVKAVLEGCGLEVVMPVQHSRLLWRSDVTVPRVWGPVSGQSGVLVKGNSFVRAEEQDVTFDHPHLASERVVTLDAPRVAGENGKKLIVTLAPDLSDTIEDLRANDNEGFIKKLAVICDAMRGCLHLHEQGLVHGDIKPSNILIVDGRGKLSDLEDVLSQGPSLGNCIRCTPSYYDGNYYLGNDRRVVSAASDVFAFGIILMRLFCGQNQDGFFVSRKEAMFNLNIPEEVQDMIEKMLAPNRESRPDVKEVLVFFDNYLRTYLDVTNELLKVVGEPAILTPGDIWKKFMSLDSRYC